MDTAPPAIVEPAPPPPPRVAATDFYARGSREAELCESASKPDWLYLAIPPALVAGAVVLDAFVFKYDQTTLGTDNAFVRDLGPALVGATWGLFVGGFHPSMPKCSPHFVTTAPPEGQVRTSWPIALSFALLAGITAPVVDFIAIGPVPDAWSDGERVSRIIVAGAFGFGMALFPYLVAPKPLRAMRELINLRATVSAHGTYLNYTLHF